MGLFTKDSPDNNTTTIAEPIAREKKPMKNDKDPIASVIAKEMTINGEVSFQGKARFDGTVIGNIAGEYLILSDTAMVKGNIKVTTLVCHGKVEGDIVADVVTAHTTSWINGVLKATTLTVESGATLEGEIHASARRQGQQEAKKSTLSSPTPVTPAKNKDKADGAGKDKK